jgi:hypothetical protein
MNFTFDVGNLDQLKRAFMTIREVNGVIRVARG